MNSIVIYCSHTGTTEKIAKKIGKDTGSALVKVEPDILYGNFVQTVRRVIADHRKGIVPGYVTDIPELGDVDTVFVGYPIWAGDIPEFMQEFLQACDFNGKKVIPFATSKMTDMTASLDTLSAICDGAEVLEPFFYGVTKRDRYADWLEAVRNLPEKAYCCPEEEAGECCQEKAAEECCKEEEAAEECCCKEETAEECCKEETEEA